MYVVICLLKTVLTEKDKFCENAVLDTPAQRPTACETAVRDVELPNRNTLEFETQDER